jgi:hypothetical protein
MLRYFNPLIMYVYLMKKTIKIQTVSNVIVYIFEGLSKGDYQLINRVYYSDQKNDFSDKRYEI